MWKKEQEKDYLSNFQSEFLRYSMVKKVLHSNSILFLFLESHMHFSQLKTLGIPEAMCTFI